MKIIKLGIFFSLVIFIFVKQANPDELNDARLLFHQGNAYYSEERFEEAITYYEETLSLGFESGPLYYNLGNAYFKHDFLGKAILNYLRAKRFIPKDADLKSNLNYAQSLIKGGSVVPERKWFARIFFNAADSFSLERITLFSVTLYFILSTLIILFILIKNLRRILTCIIGAVLAFLVLYVAIFFTQFHKTIIQKQAVIIAESSDSKFEPFDDATTFFTLNEGEGVSMVASRKDWVKIKRVDGRQGWIKLKDIELL